VGAHFRRVSCQSLCLLATGLSTWIFELRSGSILNLRGNRSLGLLAFEQGPLSFPTEPVLANAVRRSGFRRITAPRYFPSCSIYSCR
jgi:hypothetical protein